jgi:hypothetical protein
VSDVTAAKVPTIRSRRPTGEVPLPFILVEGEAKSGRTWTSLRLSASPRVGRTFLLDLIDGIGDEYGRIPGADFEILIPAGDEWTHADILDQILAVKAEAARARRAGEPPVTLVIDTITALWNSFKDWTTERAKQSQANQRKLARDPNADVTVPRHLWNATDKRYQKIIEALKTFPGIVVATANGREVSATGPDGQPIEGKKTYSVQAEKDIVGDATVTIRMKRTAPPEVVAARSAVNGVQPGKDEPQPIAASEAVGPDGNLLEWLIFTALGCDPATRHVRDVHAVTAGELTPEERGADPRAEVFRDRALERGHTHDSLGALYAEVRQAGLIGAVVIDDHGDEVTLDALVNRLGRELQATAANGNGQNGHHPNGDGHAPQPTDGRPPRHSQAQLDWLAVTRSQIDAAIDDDLLRGLWAIVSEARKAGECAPFDADTLYNRITNRRALLANLVDPDTLRTMHIRLSDRKVKSGDDHRCAASRILGHAEVVETTKHLSLAEALKVIYECENAPIGTDMLTGQVAPADAGQPMPDRADPPGSAGSPWADPAEVA